MNIIREGERKKVQDRNTRLTMKCLFHLQLQRMYMFINKPREMRREVQHKSDAMP